MKTLLRNLAIGGLLSLTSMIHAADLELTINNIKNSKGDLWIMVYSGAGGFNRQDNQAAEAMIKIPAKKGEAKIKLYNLSRGDYAISVLHDENGNGKEDKKDGYSNEAYGFSRNVGKHDMPTFSSAAIYLKENQETHITLINPEN